MGDCVVCGRRVDWSFVKVEFTELLDQADHYGADSLTEAAQVVYEGKCCYGYTTPRFKRV